MLGAEGVFLVLGHHSYYPRALVPCRRNKASVTLQVLGTGLVTISGPFIFDKFS